MVVTGKVQGGEKLKAIVQKMQKVAEKGKQVTIGVQGKEEGQTHAERGLTLASILAIHEFGTEDGHVPERAPLRTTSARHSKQWTSILARGIKRIIRGEMQQDQVLGLLGERAVADTKIIMRKGLPPPLKESTLKKIKGPRKQDPTALIDTETLFKSLSWAIRDRGNIKKQGGQDA